MSSDNIENSINLFNFSEVGYGPLDFDALSRDFSSMSQLQGMINVIDFQSDYLKYCESSVIGYERNSIQIFQHKCVYVGIRDLLASVQSYATQDLSSYIVPTVIDFSDILFRLKGWTNDSANLVNAIKAQFKGELNLLKRINPVFSEYSDIEFMLDVFQAGAKELNNSIRGWSISNIRDLANTIKIWYPAEDNLPTYLKSTIQEEEDLPARVHKVFLRDSELLEAILHGWQVADLKFLLQSLHLSDLTAIVRATYLSNILVYLYAIQPVDIKVFLHGLATQDLPVEFTLVKSPFDLDVSINPIQFNNLPISIIGRKGLNVYSNLNAFLTNFTEANLPIALRTFQFRDLNAILNSSKDSSELQVLIYPKVVNVKYNVYISFLSNSDIGCVINFPCMSSGYLDLAAFITGKFKSDLRGYIYGLTYDNISDLNFRINSFNYIANDSIELKYFNSDNVHSSKVDIVFNKHPEVLKVDTIPIYHYNINKAVKDLGFYIKGEYLQSNLKATIRAYSNPHYNTTTLTSFIMLKLKDNMEDFKRQAEITFNSYAKSYIYFSGNQRAYKEFKNDRWVVQVEGFEMLPVGEGFEKAKVMRKYIFNLKQYNSIDDAVRDMLDRVTQPRVSDLPVFLTPSYNFNDLRCSVFTKRIYKTNRIIRAYLNSRMKQDSTLTSTITPILRNGNEDLNLSLTGINYDHPENGVVDFHFIGSGDPIPSSNAVNFDFKFEGQ